MKERLIKISLIIGLLGVLTRTILIYSVGSMVPGYDPMVNFLSELSAEGAPYEFPMNYFGLIFLGISFFIGSFGLGASLPKPRVKATTVLVALSGLGYLGIGLLPCSPGCDMNVYPERMKAHMACAFLATIFAVLAPLIYSSGIFIDKNHRSLRLFSLIVSLVGLTAFLSLWAFVIAYFQGIELSIGAYRGLLQRINVTSGDLWLLVVFIRSLMFPGLYSSVKSSV